MSVRNFNVSHRWEVIHARPPMGEPLTATYIPQINIMQCNVCFELWFSNKLSNCICG